MPKSNLCMPFWLMVVALGSLMSAAFGYVWQTDAATGLQVARLSTQTGNNYALYYHDRNNTADGRFLVYRNMTNSSASSLTYYKLDLETGVATPIYTTGLANGANIYGNYLYAMTRSTVNDPYRRMSRFDLTTLVKEDLCDFSYDLGGAFTINSNGTNVLAMTLTSGTRRLFCYEIASDTLTELWNTTAAVEHVQFHPGNWRWYTYINQDAGYGLSRIGVGKIDTNEHSPLYSTDSYLNSAYYPHPHYESGGSLWSDALWSNQTSQNYYVRFTMTETPYVGKVAGYVRVPIANSQWQVHANSTRGSCIFAGDGQGTADFNPSLGEKYIHLFRPDPVSLTTTQWRIADGVGTDVIGGVEPNVHTLNTADGVVWSAYRTDTGGLASNTNVFLVKLPNILKAQITSMAAGSWSAPGPWKHGNLITIAPNNGSWYCDYGSPTSFGDGVTNMTGGSISSVGATNYYDMADTNGDDVEDRILKLWLGNGQWQLYSTFTDYSGVFSNDWPDNSATYTNSMLNYPPVLDDLDGNGYDDVVTLRVSGSSILWDGRLNLNNGFPGDTLSPSYSNAAFGDPLVDEYTYVADINGDGRADRITVRPNGTGWEWRCNYTTSSGFSTSTVNTTCLGAVNATDIPMVDDINGDGLADVVIARYYNGSWRWYARITTGSGFGTSWTWGPTISGSAANLPLIGHQTNFVTRQ